MAQTIQFEGNDGVKNVSTATPFPVTSIDGGSSAEAGNGAGLYTAKPSGTNADAISAYSTSTAITVTGLPYSFTKYDIISIEQIASTGATKTWVDKNDWTVSGTTITVANASFGASDNFVVVFSLPAKTIDTTNNAQDVSVINKFNDSSSTLAALTNIAQTTTAYLYADVQNSPFWTLQCETSGVTPTDTLTLTVEATCQDDGTAPSSCTYHDITEMVYDYITGTTSNASFVDVDCVLGLNFASKFKYVRLKYVTSTGGGNDADLTVYFCKG